MKKFETPSMEVEMLEIEDVITTSNEPTECVNDNTCGNDTGEW